MQTIILNSGCVKTNMIVQLLSN